MKKPSCLLLALSLLCAGVALAEENSHRPQQPFTEHDRYI